MRILLLLLASLALAAGPLTAWAAVPPADAASRAEALIDGFVAKDTFSGAVLVARDGQPLLRKAYGLADREWSTPNTPDAKFRLGSLTKAFTATAILQLQEAGKLSVDDPISKYYADAPKAWQAVTLRHLLTHSSGIPSYTAISGFFAGQGRLDRTPAEIIQLTQDKPLEFEPGSKYAYDNSGYILLGYVVEKVSGQRYADYLQDHIFGPLGMASSGYDVSTEVLAHRASGYDWTPKGFINTPYLSMTEPFAAGSLYSTVDDMLRWDQSFYSGQLLKPASMKAMFTDYGHGYGFAWVLDKVLGHPRISHSGGINGFVTRFERYPDDKLTVIVLANETNAPVGRIATDLAAIYLDAPPRTALAGGEALIRKQFDSVIAGAPDYAHTAPALVEATRAALPAIQHQFQALGPIQSVTLEAADPDGSDYYLVKLAHGTLRWVLTAGPDGGPITAGVGPE